MKARYFTAEKFSQEFDPPIPMQQVWKLMRENRVPVKSVGSKKYVDMNQFENTTGNILADSLIDDE